MSNTSNDGLINCAECPTHIDAPLTKRLPGSQKILGAGMNIERFLPTRQLRMIGAWIFLDHIGPADVSEGDGVQVGPHPHTGLQTFTWMVEGEMFHRDSLGSEQLIRPGQVNLMTAGSGISHSEESPTTRSPDFHAAQLWIALPDSHRFIAPAFEHHPVLPKVDLATGELTVIAGQAFGHPAPTTTYTPLMAAEIRLTGKGNTRLPLDPKFEYGLLAMSGQLEVNGETLDSSELLYLGCGHQELHMQHDTPCRLLLIGGTPFEEEVLMWWNFLGRSKGEIAQFVEDWNTGQDFGVVHGFKGDRLAAPSTPW